ncbi:MAG TPA: TonB family protein [Caldimonas sp.]|nr:TonB family protein [Caldimonas sp.]
MVGVMSGTPERPAAGFSLLAAPIGAANARRLSVAVLAVVGLHVALLAVRLGAGSASPVAPSASPVIAIRMVQAPLVAPTAQLPVAAATSARVEPTPRAVETAGQPVLDRQAPERPVHKPSGAPAIAPAPRAEAAAEAPASLAATAATAEAKGGDTPLAAAPDYALGVRLDPGPRPLTDIEPEYPDITHLREGVVVLRLLISERGGVDNVAVVRAEPRGVFEQAAIEAFAKARFSPGLAAGTPVKSQITVEVQFMPINRGARVSGRTY